MSNRSIQVVADLNAVAVAAADQIARVAGDAIANRGDFSIALSGGSTPKTLFQLLAGESYAKCIDWKNWRIYFGDERCVPPDHPDSNFRMASEALLDRVPIPPDHVHRMKGEIDPQRAATEYGQLLKNNFGDGGLDLILLGMGDDGHTASLFPNTAALAETSHRCVANFVEKFGVWRITMTAPFINRARQIVVMVSGATKAKRVEQVLESPRDTPNLPIQLIDPPEGRFLWLMDSAAAGMAK
ncbi:MAG TPA: 6-phosphogluconolactonase [Tepidisphaeraceae bacterium]|jgi:6-phosphogluconolactonase|nr:6-phosphogluconolactonase [Tepidisphaeraceae bacterium]